MRLGRYRAALLVIAVLLSGARAHAIERGQPLAAALEELRRSGLQLVFSSALVEPSFTVNVDPGQGSAEIRARRILAPYGLTLDPIKPGLFAIVRRQAGADSVAVAEIRVEQSDGVPIAGALVTLPAKRRSERTNAQGIVRFEDLEPGEYDVIASADGYVGSQLHRVRLNRGERAQVAMPLAPILGPLLEVDVYASRYAIDRQHTAALAELTREDLAARPGLDQDVLRVTRFLPGTASNALSARTHVRGGREDELAVYFDGVPLFEPFHFKDLQGFLGILDPNAISGVDFFSGVFPARYGNRLSGVLDIRPRAWTGEDYHELGASVLYTSALSQGRLDSHPVEWLTAVRHSNIEAVAHAVDRDDIEPDFLDALGRLQFDVSDRSSFALGWLLLDDVLDANILNEERSTIGYRDATGWASWQYRPHAAFESRVTLALTERNTNRDGTLERAMNASGTVDDRRRFDTGSARVESTMRLTDRVRIEGGVELYNYDATYRYRSSTTYEPAFARALGRPEVVERNSDIRIDGQAYAGYLSALTSIAPNADLDIGLRWDKQHYDVTFHDDQVSPRVSFQYRYDPSTILRLSWGSFAQAQRADELLVQDGETAFNPVQRARQTVASLERRLWSGDALFRVEAYDKRVSRPSPTYENLLDPFALLPELEVDRVRIAPDRSRAYGAEMSLRWDARRRWSSWASYSVSRATDYFADVAAPRTWEQNHSLNAGVSWTQRPWLLSANVTWHTGWRRNALNLVSDAGDPVPVLELSPRNARAWPEYFSLDLRASWLRKMPRGTLQAFIEIDNATNHGNLCCINYQLAPSDAGPVLIADTSNWLPRFALFGVSWQLP
jgi:hypothetical protein